MSGIVGYAGREAAASILIDGLTRLEYRGYDSAGIAVQTGHGLHVVRTAGRVADLEEMLRSSPAVGTSGIGHLRWATHGAPTPRNAHPHRDCTGRIALVHNGFIDNAGPLRALLRTEGHDIQSETDSEILAHLIERYWVSPLHLSVARALSVVEGTYAIAVMSDDEPGRIVAARKGAPLLVGIGPDANYVTSDVASIMPYTRRVVYLEDWEMATVDRGGVDIISTEKLQRISKVVLEVDRDLESVEKEGFPHFMAKEIWKQPEGVSATLRGRILPDRGVARLGELTPVASTLAGASRITLLGCGTSWHAALLGQYMIEEYAGVPVDVEYASEWRYRDPVVDPHSVVMGLSHSGETADTLAAVRAARERGHTTVGIVNAVGSSIARVADANLYLHAGPEVGVASTARAFTSQVVSLALLALFMGRQRGLDDARATALARALLRLPDQLREVLERTEGTVEALAEKFCRSGNFLYLGRGYGYPSALEGALKLKEIGGAHAEAVSAAELKFGPFALVDDGMPVIAVAPPGPMQSVIHSNLREVHEAGGRIIVVTTEPNELGDVAEQSIVIPATIDPLLPVLTTIPLQLLAYHVGVARGYDVDRLSAPASVAAVS
jgi:glucosamine--fructose-6-phosphate aminotransferase (isomerizing)